jgi:hypothetical protein
MVCESTGVPEADCLCRCMFGVRSCSYRFCWRAFCTYCWTAIGGSNRTFASVRFFPRSVNCFLLFVALRVQLPQGCFQRAAFGR